MVYLSVPISLKYFLIKWVTQVFCKYGGKTVLREEYIGKYYAVTIAPDL